MGAIMIFRGHVFSRTLQMETGLSVLVPDKADRDRPYRVVYLLHGICGRSGDWLEYSMLPVFARTYGAILVMPEVARSFYADQTYGLKYFQYVAEELPDIVGQTFNVAAGRENTAVVGCSMGGYGALRLALTHPGRYGWAAGLAPACLYLDEGIPFLRANPEQARAAFGEQLVTDLAAVFGPDFAWDESYSIRSLAAKALAAPERPRLSVSCGTEDGMMIGDCRRFRDDMAALGYPLAYDEWSGGHDWTFFNRALELALGFCFAG
jgi:putative tributyrin esterase